MTTHRLIRLPAVGLALGLALLCAPRAAADWSAPQTLWPTAWPTAGAFATSDAGDWLVVLAPYGGSDARHRPLYVSRRTADGWSAPQTLALNAAHPDPSGFIPLPQYTRPQISAAGDRIAWVGYDDAQQTYRIYLSTRSGTAWSAPAPLATPLANHHYWISLSADGDWLAYSDYPFLGTQQLYVSARGAGGWGAPQPITADSFGGGSPALSGDGRVLAFVRNANLAVSTRNGGGWTPPLLLTAHDWTQAQVEYPTVSRDGGAIAFWLVQLRAAGGAYLRESQALYVTRHTDGGWTAPQRVTQTDVIPSFAYDGPPALNADATRIVTTRPLRIDDTISAADLWLSEALALGWAERRLVTHAGYGDLPSHPWLPADGRTLTWHQFQSGFGTRLLRSTTPDGVPPLYPLRVLIPLARRD